MILNRRDCREPKEFTSCSLCYLWLKSLILLIILFFPGQGIAQSASSGNEDFPTGQIIENAPIRYDDSQSYVVYLPKPYTRDKKWPILYCFDPAARGKVPVMRFQAAAEKFGYILVGSNNSRNGLETAPLTDIIQNFWKETHDKFSIDDSRVYAAGFSGGARVASGVAYNCKGCIAGVIGCGAGFAVDMKSYSALPFVFSGIAGVDDFNYYELKNLEENLKANNTVNHLEIFEGAHQWPPEEFCTAALEWMELQAMKKGLRAKEPQMIESAFSRRFEEAKADMHGGKNYDAYLKLEALESDFKELRDSSEAEQIRRKIEESTEIERERKREKEQFRRQREIVQELIGLGMGLRNLEERIANRQLLRARIAELKKISKKAEDDADRRVARRSLNQAFASTYEAATLYSAPKKDYDLAVLNLEIAAEISENNPFLFYERARMYALQGDKKKAVEMLREAVKNGFKDGNRLAAERAFESLHKVSSFRKITDSLGKD